MHASLIDGLQLCKAEWQRFNHNDMDHLERLLVRHRGHYRNVWIVTESIFSMDGDCAPLATLQALKTKYDLKLYVDEAHAFGVCGPGGRGLADATGTDCDILVATLGKAIASQGAFVITDGEIREFLVNRLRTLIFSTPLPPISLPWSDYVIRRLPQMEPWREHLNLLSHRLTGSPSSTHIIPLMAGENHRAIEMSKKFREAGFWIEKIAELVKEKRVDGITDLRDESDRQGMRIVIELRRDVNANVILNQLLKHTQLQDTFGVIITSQLDVEVGLAGLGEGALIDDVHTAGIGLCLEVVPDTDGVLVIVFVDDGDLRTVEVLIDVLGGTGALVGVGEADLEHVIIVVDGNDIVAGGGGGQGEHPVLRW